MSEQSEPVGSLAEELAKLMGVVSGLAERTTNAAEDGDIGNRDNGHGDDEGTRRTNAAGEHAHIADGSASCQVCPVCQTIAFVRSTSPEVREHLAASAASLAAATRGLVDAFVAHQQADDAASTREPRVENIDLSEDGPWD